MRLNLLARWGFVGMALLAAGCGGRSRGNPPASGADLATSGMNAPADLAVAAPSGDLAVAMPADLAMAAPTSLPDLATKPSPPDLATKPSPPDMTDPTPPPPDLAVASSGPPKFSTDVLPILQNNGCFGGCHMSAVWSAAVADANDTAALVAYLTSTNSSQCSTMRMVTTNDAANSYLYEKISGIFPTQCKSDPMPQGNGPLPTAQSDIVKAWINAGALDN
jgi:hypothetical protein